MTHRSSLLGPPGPPRAFLEGEPLHLAPPPRPAARPRRRPAPPASGSPVDAPLDEEIPSLDASLASVITLPERNESG